MNDFFIYFFIVENIGEGLDISDEALMNITFAFLLFLYVDTEVGVDGPMWFIVEGANTDAIFHLLIFILMFYVDSVLFWEQLDAFGEDLMISVLIKI